VFENLFVFLKLVEYLIRLHQELSESERRAKDAILLQVRQQIHRLICIIVACQLSLSAQHEEHLGAGGFSASDEVIWFLMFSAQAL
jgi:hypothetical protein